MRVIVAGAGPGGASAALALARAGATVELLEKARWPRDKTCGDGISPLAFRQLERLGAAVRPSLTLRQALVHTPGGTAFRGGWPDATPWGSILERRTFDGELVDAAIRAGVSFEPETAVEQVASDDAGVAITVARGDRERTLRADFAIIADGANGGLAKRLGFPPYRSRLIAVRGYARARRDLAPEYGLFYDRALSPGYGWIFPVDERLANVGICVDERVLRRSGGNIRALLRQWLDEKPLVRELFGDAVHVERTSGGIIPSGRARRASGRVLLAGDAAGVADPFTAEGIYEAITSGRLAARAIVDASSPEMAGRDYERALRFIDRNERSARALRATFGVAIEPYARFATMNAAFANRLMTGVFFAKPGFVQLLWHLHFGRSG